MEKNEVYTGKCTGLSEEGLGVVRIDKFVIFVPNLLPEEVAEIGITKMKKNYGYGRVVKLLQPSLHRVEPKCSISRPCGGCHIQHMDDLAQREFKENKVKDCFHKIANIEITPLPIIKEEPYWNYRNKVQIPVQVKDGEVLLGFYQNHTNRIVPYKECHVQTPLSNALTHYFKEALQKYECGEYFRHILIKHAHVSGEVMVGLIVRQYPFPNIEELTEDIVKHFPQITSLIALENTRNDNVIVDGQEIILAGKPYITEELLGCRFKISAKSFFQINPYATKKLYAKAIEYANLTGNETLVDLYCGTGTMGIIAAKHAKKVYGVEIVPEAIEDAKLNAEMNHVNNIEFMNADASKGAEFFNENNIHVDAIIIDPPRKGCSKETLDAIIKMSPKRLVYVSCDPATLARDVRILVDNGFQLGDVQPCDMFPFTTHCENICALTRKD